MKKMMHDGIHSFVPQQQSSRHDAAAELSEALRHRLAELGATQHWLMHRKTLQKSDVDENQNRLLVSCKRGGGGTDDYQHPITRCFSPAELQRVNKKNAGLWVTTLDNGDGDGGAMSYALTCKFLGSNNGYRFIGQWKNFLTRHGMNLNSQRQKVWTRDVEVELWAFRSHQLPFQPQLDAEDKVVRKTTVDENNKKVTVVRRIEHHLHPDGALSLILLLHENRRRVKCEENEEEDDDDDDWEGPSSPPMVVARKQSDKRDASAASSVALPAPVAEQGWAVLSESEQIFNAAIGLVRLQESTWTEWQEQVDRGRGAKGTRNGNS